MDQDDQDDQDAPKGGIGRRAMFGAAGTTLVAGGLLGYGGARLAHREPAPLTARAYPLRNGAHQQGIVTPAQDYLFCAAYEVTTSKLDDLRTLMRDWCVAAEQMCAGELVGGAPVANRLAAPRDTGEAWGYPPSSLTITVGVGPGLFRTAEGADRFGLSGRITPVLAEGLPRFANESLRANQSGGELLVQACADDAQVAIHAVRNLTRIAMGTAALKWTPAGQGRTSSTSAEQETPRNLFGFKDGTNNVLAEDGTQQLDEHLWVQPGDPGGDWLAGGSYLVIRKIRMFLEMWDRISLLEQEETMGRDKRFGAPLSLGEPTSADDEFVAPDYGATRQGSPVIPVDSHIRLVSPENNQGARMLRRGYNYTDGNTGLGQIDGGLFFEAFVRDPRSGFYEILHRMTRSDALTEYLQHVGTGLFAVLPGVGATDTMFGQRLFG